MQMIFPMTISYKKMI